MELSGATAVVTGGVGDIGRAIGKALVDAGATVELWDTAHPDDGDARAHRVGCAYRAVDVRDASAVRAAVEDLTRLDIAIGCAGIVRSAPFLEITSADWHDHLEVNLAGCFHLGQAAARKMVGAGVAGRIVFIGSWVGSSPWSEIAAYSASKAGVGMLARSMAGELAGHGIRVNVVAPGIVDAGLARHQMETEPQYAARVATAIPLGELQRPESVASAVLFACSPAASYMTGSVLLVDGGASLRIDGDGVA